MLLNHDNFLILLAAIIIASCESTLNPPVWTEATILAVEALDSAVEAFADGGVKAVRQPPNFDLESGHYVFCIRLPRPGRFLSAKWVVHPVKRHLGSTASDLMDDPIIGPYIEETAEQIFGAAWSLNSTKNYGLATYLWDNDLEGKNTELVAKTSMLRWFSYKLKRYVCGIQIAVEPAKKEEEEEEEETAS